MGIYYKGEEVGIVIDNYIRVPASEDGFYKLHIEQIIRGGDCILQISPYTGQKEDNYLVGEVIEGDKAKLYVTRI